MLFVVVVVVFVGFVNVMRLNLRSVLVGFNSFNSWESILFDFIMYLETASNCTTLSWMNRCLRYIMLRNTSNCTSKRNENLFKLY